MTIALASPHIATSLDDGLANAAALIADASSQGARIVCFPEAYLPGLRGLDFDVPDYDRADEERVLAAIGAMAREHAIAVVMGMEHVADSGGQIVATVFDAEGTIQGVQPKCQLDPSEEAQYVPGDSRRMFDVGGVRFGVVICHEGFRYPETVRWAAMRGASVVFHQHLTGSDHSGVVLTEWGASTNPYYERAMAMRSVENTVYFASVGCATRYQESATSIIDPDGDLVAHLPYGQSGVLVAEIDPARATGLLARRYAPERYRELSEEAVRSDDPVRN